MKHKYSYVVLRYVHDIMSGEQLNVGVVVYSSQGRFFQALCRPTYHRLSLAFPGLRGDSFRSVLRFVQSEIADQAERLFLDSTKTHPTIADLVGRVLPRDESSFQWSEPGFGVATDLLGTLDELYERLVTRYDERTVTARKSDEDVWKKFSTELERRRVLQFLKPKVIATKNDEVEFSHAWKNGAWHCLQPASFDLSRPDKIRDKAHKILGELVSLQESSEEFKVYLLVGSPESPTVEESYRKALRNLEVAGNALEIVTEDRAVEFVAALASRIQAHEQDHLFDQSRQKQ